MTKQMRPPRSDPQTGDPDKPDAVTKTPETHPRSDAGWGRKVANATFGILLGAAVVLAVLQIPAIRKVIFGHAAFAETPVAPDLPDTPFLAHAKEAGIDACGTVFPILGQMLTAGMQYNVQSDWNAAEPDQHAIQALVGMTVTSPDHSGPGAGIVFAAPNASDCEGVMVRVVPFPQDCAALSAMLPPDSSKRSDLARIAVYELADNGGEVMLLPSQQSCIAITIAQASQR